MNNKNYMKSLSPLNRIAQNFLNKSVNIICTFFTHRGNYHSRSESIKANGKYIKDKYKTTIKGITKVNKCVTPLVLYNAEHEQKGTILSN